MKRTCWSLRHLIDEAEPSRTKSVEYWNEQILLLVLERHPHITPIRKKKQLKQNDDSWHISGYSEAFYDHQVERTIGVSGHGDLVDIIEESSNLSSKSTLATLGITNR